jgi:hypothetical protein
MRRLLSLSLTVLALSGVSGCFNVDKPTCSYACSDTTPKCPDDYECRTDGYCHLTGTTASCSFADASVAPIVDMSMPHDLVSTTD